jgi:hypothetical protein
MSLHILVLLILQNRGGRIDVCHGLSFVEKVRLIQCNAPGLLALNGWIALLWVYNESITTHTLLDTISRLITASTNGYDGELFLKSICAPSREKSTFMTGSMMSENISFSSRRSSDNRKMACSRWLSGMSLSITLLAEKYVCLLWRNDPYLTVNLARFA